MFEREAERILDAGLVFPAFEYTLKCSHTFNLLDSRGALSVMERTRYIKRVQRLARRCATTYLNLEGNSPLLNQSA
jgi:glycyl-tRNA synthetase alpha chain